jgi:glycosyltransferase involved in cell wall biosynthesis
MGSVSQDFSWSQLRVMHVFGGHVRSGVESIVLDLADGLRGKGGLPILVPLKDGPFADEARDLGFVVWPLGKKRRYDLARIPAATRLIRRGQVHVLHSHAVNGAFYAVPAGRLAGVRSQICTFHGDAREHLRDVYRRSLPRALSHRYFLALARGCDGVISVSETLRASLIQDGISPDKIVCIENGIDVGSYERASEQRGAIRAQLGITPETTLIGSVSRLAETKDLPMFLHVAQRLLIDRPGLRFVVAGDGPDRDELHALASRLHLGARVAFVGWRDDPAEFTSALDIFVLTSRSETGPLTSLGAMALGIPVVSTDVGVIHELDEFHELGLVVSCGDAQAMAAAIGSLLDNGGKKRAAEALGREIVQRRFTRDVMVRRTLQYYARVLGGVPDLNARRSTSK